MGSIISIAQSFLLTNKRYKNLNKEQPQENVVNNTKLPVPSLVNRKPIKDIEAALESNLDLV